MNWFTQTSMVDASLEAKKASVERWGGCEHVEANSALLHMVAYENDSCGREGMCLCAPCSAQAQAQKDAELVTCNDCKQEFKTVDTISWKWYDFYAAQGDEPVCVCKECRGKPAHQRRVQVDRANELDEFPED